MIGKKREFSLFFEFVEHGNHVFPLLIDESEPFGQTVAFLLIGSNDYLRAFQVCALQQQTEVGQIVKLLFYSQQNKNKSPINR
jgi:hypothetical protein